METVLQDYGRAAASMSEEQKAALIAKVLKQKEAARKRAKDQNEAKKKAGIKTITIEVPGKYVKVFNNLVTGAKKSRTEFFIEMLESCKPGTNQGDVQGTLFRESRSSRDKQQVRE